MVQYRKSHPRDMIKRNIRRANTSQGKIEKWRIVTRNVVTVEKHILGRKDALLEKHRAGSARKLDTGLSFAEINQ